VSEIPRKQMETFADVVYADAVRRAHRVHPLRVIRALTRLREASVAYDSDKIFVRAEDLRAMLKLVTVSAA